MGGIMRSCSTWDAELRGRWFGGNHDTDHKGSLFLPAAGWRGKFIGELVGRSLYGTYWSSSSYGGYDNYAGLELNSGSVYPLYGKYITLEFSARCVRDK